VYYVVGERRLRPGTADAYIAYAQRVSQDWAGVTSQDAYFLFVDRDSAERVLIVGSWPDRAAFYRAYATIPPERREIAGDAVLEGTGEWRWYTLAGELRTFGHEPRVATATGFVVDPSDSIVIREWAARLRAAAREVAGLVLLRLLESIDEPGTFVQLGVFADEVAADLLGALAEDVRPPRPVGNARSFVGLVGFRWSQYDARTRHST
jgi:quinol monooxygenase YgiN